MNIHEVEIRTLETEEQRRWFYNLKHDEMNRPGTLFSLIMENGSLGLPMVIKLSVLGLELIYADGEIWPVCPNDNFKEIFGLNPVKFGTTRQHLRQNHFASDDEGKYEGLIEAMQKSSEARQKWYEAAMKQYIDSFYIGGTSGSENKNYGRAEEVRGHPDQNHIRKNHFASDDEGKYEGLIEAMQKSSEARQKWYEAAMKQNIDGKKANDEHVVDMPKSPGLSSEKEQANDGLFRLCELGLANTVSLTGSNPPLWAATDASQRLLGFSGAANAVGYVGTTAALSLRYTKPRAARIFANVGLIGCAWGVIMGFTSYLPGEFQWLGYVAAVFCTLAVLLANY